MTSNSTTWLTLIADVSVKSILLFCVAGAAIAALRIRDANLKHRIWLAAMLGMMCLPWLVAVTPPIPWFTWPANTWANMDDGANVRTAVETSSANRATHTALHMRPIGEQKTHPFDHSSSAMDASIQSAQVDSIVAKQAAPTLQPMADFPRTMTSTFSRIWPTAAMVVYVAGALLFTIRICIGFLKVNRMAQDSVEVHPQNMLDTPGIQILQSAYTHVPLTLGVLRPKVLLPESWESWDNDKLSTVLTHELAHIKRQDWLVTMLGELNRAVYWFHPLAWFLRKQLADLAEHSCDDAVIEAKRNRIQYAKHLLEVAVSVTKSGKRFALPAPTVAMARKPIVESRINAILDENRRLSKRLGLAGVVALSVVAIPTIVVAAGLKPQTKDEPTVATKVKSKEGDSPPVDRNEKPFIYEGTVLLPNGQPAAGAAIHFVYWYSDQSQTPKLDTLATTDRDGRFRFEMNKTDFFRTGDSVPPWQWARLVAKKNGYGISIAESLAFETSGQVLEGMLKSRGSVRFQREKLEQRIEAQDGQIRLRTNKSQIRGRVVSTEGQPIPGLKVRLLELRSGQDGTLDAWKEGTKDPRADFYKLRNKTPKSLHGPLVSFLMAPQITDRNGEFTIDGVGDEWIARFVIEGKNIESADVYCRTRKGDKVEVTGPMPQERMVVHSTRFLHVALPSKPVTGVVRDKSTGKPIANVLVSSYRSYTSTAAGKFTKTGSEFARAVTDKEGKYTLQGLPNTRRNAINFKPPADTSLLSSFVQVDTDGNDLNPVSQDVKLERGVVINGFVRDAASGEGVSGTIQYRIRTKKTAQPFTRMLPRVEDCRSDVFGKFQLVVPPGDGFLTFSAFDQSYLKKAHRPKNSVSLGNHFLAVFSTEERPEYHAVASLSLDPDQKEYSVKMQVSRAPLISGKIVDRQGNPVSGAWFTGRNEYPFWEKLTDETFVVAGYNPQVPRRLVFAQQEKKLSGTFVLKGAIQDEQTIRLKPWASIKGRIVDGDGEPMSDLTLTVGSFRNMMPVASPDTGGEFPIGFTSPQIPLPNFSSTHDKYVTDDDGRFSIEGLVAGEKYNVLGINQRDLQIGNQGEILVDLVLKEGQSLDLGDIIFTPFDFAAFQRELQKQAEKKKKVNSETQNENKNPPEGIDR